MNNQTKSISSPGLIISLGHLASVFSLLFILLLILITLFFLFTKQKNNYLFDEHELPSRIITTSNERQSCQFQQSKQYSSTMNSQASNSFQIDMDSRSTINLLSSK